MLGTASCPRVSKSRTAQQKEIGPPLDRVRLAVLSDAPHILPLCNESMKTIFRVSTVEGIEYLIENSVFALCQLNVKNDVVGFLSLREYPLVPAVDPCAWEEYIWTKYKTIELNARNTLWIHLMCWKRCYSREVVEALLRSVYMHDPYIHHTCWIKTTVNVGQLVPGSSRVEAVFRRVQVMERGVTGDKLPTLFISDRVNICPRLRVRRAVEEDNDDLVPIIERHSERIRELYGDYYISELIARHPESERVLLVCEHNELPVGMMILNTQINFDSLEECFELSPYAGLRNLDQAPHKHKSWDDSCSYVSDGNLESNYASSHNLDSMSAINAAVSGISGNTISRTSQGVEKLCDSLQRVQFTEEVGDRDKQKEHQILCGVDDGQVIGNMSILEYLDLFTDDEEEVEYDIVNIDPELLKVPYLDTSCDPMSKNLLDCVTNKEDIDPDPLLEGMPLPKRGDKKKYSSSMSKAPDYIIRYSGTPNAFLLELCCMHQDYDERNAFDMLEAAFEIFPDRDYCIISLPSNHPPFPLLENFSNETSDSQ